MKALIKGLLQQVSPALVSRIKARRTANQQARVLQRTTLALGHVVAQQGWVIKRGPFKGMKYIQESRGSVLVPKLLGIYERELFACVDATLIAGFDAVIDIGCAEGYYAVGYAYRMPEAVVYAYDIDTSAQALCRELAELNAVQTRVKIGGECTHAVLETVIANHRKTLIVCDCEGFEDVLLDPANVASLHRADMLIEVHEFAAPGVTNRLLQRFSVTHNVQRTPAIPIDPSEVPEVAAFDRATQLDAVDECRVPGTEWFYLKAK